MTIPADPRSLAQEAINDGDIPASCKCGVCVERIRGRTIARALIEALDRAEQYQRDWYAAKSEFGDAMAKTRGEARALTADRDALLADLPHALGACGCVMEWRFPPCEAAEARWPEAHTAAIARVEARIK